MTGARFSFRNIRTGRRRYDPLDGKAGGLRLGAHCEAEIQAPLLSPTKDGTIAGSARRQGSRRQAPSG
jgi:hypothetical protein